MKSKEFPQNMCLSRLLLEILLITGERTGTPNDKWMSQIGRNHYKIRIVVFVAFRIAWLVFCFLFAFLRVNAFLLFFVALGSYFSTVPTIGASWTENMVLKELRFKSVGSVISIFKAFFGMSCWVEISFASIDSAVLLLCFCHLSSVPLLCPIEPSLSPHALCRASAVFLSTCPRCAPPSSAELRWAPVVLRWASAVLRWASAELRWAPPELRWALPWAPLSSAELCWAPLSSVELPLCLRCASAVPPLCLRCGTASAVPALCSRCAPLSSALCSSFLLGFRPWSLT